MKIGILVHGRHLQSSNWSRLVWGEAPVKLGSLPILVVIALSRGIENIEKIIFGSGASEKENIRESQYLLNYFKKIIPRLSEFDQILNHPHFKSIHQKPFLEELFSKIECDTISSNTSEEIISAAGKFSHLNVSEVVQITNASHAPRCLRDSAVLREENIIPSSQIWSVVPDMITYSGTYARDVVVIEPPHRGDDPFFKNTIQPSKVFSDFLNLKNTKIKMIILKEFNQMVKNIINL